MPKRKTTDQFIYESIKVHGDKYDYSKVKYIRCDIKVDISCPIENHGIFQQIPSSHLNGNGCPECSGNIQLTTENFILRAIKVHGDKYDYSKVEYIKSNLKVIIICEICGEEFKQTAGSHLAGYGCANCAKGLKRSNVKEFIKKANKIHNNKFDYSKSIYVNSRTQLTIICPFHEEFKQKPVDHIRGKGCKFCYDKLRRVTYYLSKAYKNFYKLSGYVYYIRMYNGEESFIKIGITTNLKLRMNELKYTSKYNIDVIRTKYFENFNEAIILENNEHKKYLKHSYIPINDFSGKTECFKYFIIHSPDFL